MPIFVLIKVYKVVKNEITADNYDMKHLVW